MKKWLLTVGVLLLVWTLSAQTEGSQDKVRRQRVSRIDFYHVSVGADFAVNRNFCAGAQLSVGVGSFRNVLNVDAGLRYRFLGMFPSVGPERLALHQLPLFVSLNVNAARWRTGCLYIGGEMAFTAAVAAHHRFPDGQVESDIHIGKSHFTPAAKLGCRIQDCDISFFYEYDMKPSFNQKYVYETDGYEYYRLQPAMFERMRFGVRFLYHFDF